MKTIYDFIYAVFVLLAGLYCIKMLRDVLCSKTIKPKNKDMKQDSKTISNEWHELETVAKRFNVPVSTVVRAKEDTGSNEREVIYQYLEDLTFVMPEGTGETLGEEWEDETK